jgi:PAS domain S-box-containing protein
MTQELINFIAERKKSIARKAAARERKLSLSTKLVKSELLRKRFKRLLDGMELWLSLGDFSNWLEHIDPHALSMVQKDIPLGWIFRRIIVLQTALLEDLAKRRGSLSDSYARHLELVNQFFSLFALSYAESYEKQANWLLRDAQVRHDAYFSNMITPAFLADPHGKIEEVNAAMCRSLRMSPEQIIGQTIRNFFSCICDQKSSRKDVDELYRTFKRKKRLDRFPLTLVCRERGLLHVEISATLRRNIDRQIVGIQGFVQDVTDRVKSGKLAEENRQVLEAVFENAPVGLHFVDSDRIIRMVNKTFLQNMGYPAEHHQVHVGSKIEDRFPHFQKVFKEPESMMAFIKKIEQNLEKSFAEEFSLRDNRIVVMLSAPVRSNGGEFLGRITLNHDLTKERNLEQLRENLTQMIVHDLKNPLSAISLSSAVLGRQLAKTENPRGKELIEIISRNAEAMMRMIMNLLDISRMEENKLKLALEQVNIFDLIGDLRPTLEAMAGSRTLKLPRRRYLPFIEADPGILQRIIENIVGNATKHTRPDGWISIGIRRRGEEWLHVAISDNGEGIAKEHQADVFEKFGQAAGRQRGLKTDTGLGLTFCKMAVEEHGGDIRLTSEKGKGSTFTIRLPLEQST